MVSFSSQMTLHDSMIVVRRLSLHSFSLLLSLLPDCRSKEPFPFSQNHGSTAPITTYIFRPLLWFRVSSPGGKLDILYGGIWPRVLSTFCSWIAGWFPPGSQKNRFLCIVCTYQKSSLREAIKMRRHMGYTAALSLRHSSPIFCHTSQIISGR